MTENINEILATKRDWRKAERRIEDRRKKYGTAEERKDMADVLRKGKNRISLDNDNSFNNFDVALVLLASLIFTILLFILSAPKAHAAEIPYTAHNITLSIIGEAEGESQKGKDAIACAIHYRGSLQGVYGLHAYRVRHHIYSNKVYEEAKEAYENAEAQEYCDGLIGGAQYWGSKIVDRRWIVEMKKMGYVHTATIGNQEFFRKD